MIEEIWKPVKGYEGLYEVSNLGRVKSLERFANCRYGGTCKEKILKGGKDGAGYLLVGICQNKKRKTKKVHRLVAEAFLKNPENKKTVNHKDGVKANNFVENLEWMTHKENVRHASKTGLLKTKRVVQILNGKIVKIWESQTEAGRCLGIHRNHISKCCTRTKYRHTSGGFSWSFCD